MLSPLKVICTRSSPPASTLMIRVSAASCGTSSPAPVVATSSGAATSSEGNTAVSAVELLRTSLSCCATLAVGTGISPAGTGAVTAGFVAATVVSSVASTAAASGTTVVDSGVATLSASGATISTASV